MVPYMGREYMIKPEELTVEGFAPFGLAILKPRPPAPKSGNDWDCWFPLGTLSRGEMAVGVVVTRPCNALITAMEREPKTECILPVNSPIIQAVALPGDLADHMECPKASAVRIFIVRPGQSIIMAPGTWHWAALPLYDKECVYFFITEPHPAEPGREVSPWVPFENGDAVRVVMAGI